MSSIVLNGEEVELPDSTTLALTLSAANLQDPTTRGGAYSNSFHLPRTNQMKRIIQNVDKTNAGIDSTTPIPYIQFPAALKDGGSVFQQGTAVLRETKEEHEMFFLGTNAEWASQLGDKKISEVDLSELNISWSAANVGLYRDNLWTNGIIFPNVDYGLWARRDLAKVTFNELYPAVYVKYLLKKLIEGYGYTLSGLWWYDTDERFDECVIPFSSQNFITPDYLTLNKSVGTLTTNRDYALPSTAAPFGVINTDLTWDAKVDPQSQFNLTQFTAEVSGYYLVSFDINLTLTGTLNSPFTESIYGLTTTVSVYVNGAMLDPLDYATDSLFIANRANNISFSKNYFLAAGDTVKINIEADTTLLNNAAGMSYHIVSGSSFTVAPSSGVIGTAPLSIAANLPNITQKDFIKWVANRFGIVFMTDTWTKNVRIEKLDYILGKKTDAYDWTDKMDVSQVPRRTFQLKEYAQINWLKYKEDKADPLLVLDTTYGNDYFEVLNKNIIAQKDLYLSPFAATKRGTSFNNYYPLTIVQNRTVTSIPTYREKDGISIYWYDSIVTYTNFTNLRIVVYYNKSYFQLREGQTQTGGTSFDYTKWDMVKVSDIFNQVAIVPRVGYIEINSTANENIYIEEIGVEANQPQLLFEDLKFTNAITNSYNAIIGMLTNTRVIEGLFHLNKTDIVKYLETKFETQGALIPVYLEDENGEKNYYYINEIKQFKINKSESCFVELIRL